MGDTFERDLGLPHHLNSDQFNDPPFDLPPGKKEFYETFDRAQALMDDIKKLPKEHQGDAMRAVREAVRGPELRPKRGDLDNPTRSEAPPEPRAPAAPRQRSPMASARRMQKLARKARGRRR